MWNCHVTLTQADTVSVSTVGNNIQDNDIALISQDLVEGPIARRVLSSRPGSCGNAFRFVGVSTLRHTFQKLASNLERTELVAD